MVRPHVGKTGRNGKTEAKYQIVREPLTTESMKDHLSGRSGIGCIPIKSGNVCRFGVLDIDVYDLDHAALNKKIVSLGLPLHHCRSKSGGAHLYLFLEDWEQASLVRGRYCLRCLLRWASLDVRCSRSKILSSKNVVIWVIL